MTIALDEAFEIIVVNPAPDIHQHLDDELSKLKSDGWTSYSRPSRESHPRLQVKRGRVQIALIDLGPDLTACSPVELMRATVLPQWFLQDILARAGDDVLALVLAPADAVLPLKEACRRVAGRRYKIVPIPREPGHWLAEGIALSAEIARLWAERDTYGHNWGDLVEQWFGVPN